MRPVVIAECVRQACKKQRVIEANEIPEGDVPMCECGMPMVAVRAETRP